MSTYITHRRFLQYSAPQFSPDRNFPSLHLPFKLHPTHLLHFAPFSPSVYPSTLPLNRSRLTLFLTDPHPSEGLTVIAPEYVANLPKMEPYITTRHFMRPRNLEHHSYLSADEICVDMGVKGLINVKRIIPAN